MPPSQHHEEAPEMVAQIIEATVRVSKADLLRVIQAADKTTHWDYASWLARQRLVDICHGWGSIKGTALIDGTPRATDGIDK